MNDRPAPARPAEGYFFEDFAVGRRFRHATPRTLTAGDQSCYIALTGARQPVHCSVPLARAMGHRDAPLDDLLVFNTAFEEVIGIKANSSGRNGVVYVRSRAENQDGTEVLSWIRWVMVHARANASGRAVLPELPAQVDAARFRPPLQPIPRTLTAATASPRTWEDYEPGETLDHPGGMTIEEADHMSATRLYQNTARIHFDAFAAGSTLFGRRLVYGGHVISVCRALSYEGLENAFALAAIHGGSHANPTFAGDTLYCRHVVTARQEIAGRRDVGALRLRMLGAKNMSLAQLPQVPAGEKHEAIVLDLDYPVLIPRRQST